MKIELSDRNIPCSLPAQAAKVVEEWKELEEAYHDFTRAQTGNPDMDHVAEEAFDLMEALVRWMVKKGIDIQEANRHHMKKMRRREMEDNPITHRREQNG